MLHNMIVTTIWGTPGIDQLDRLPQIPVVTVNKDGSATIEETALLGAQLKAMMGSLGTQGGNAQGGPNLKDLVPDKAKAEERAKALGEGVEITVLFVPLESGLIAALEEDATVYTEALDKRVIITTASTLLALLRTCALQWQQEIGRAHV